MSSVILILHNILQSLYAILEYGHMIYFYLDIDLNMYLSKSDISFNSAATGTGSNNIEWELTFLAII